MHGPPKLYRRPGHAGPRSKAGASWSGSAGKALRAHSAICASRAGRVTARELGAPKVRRGRKRSRKAYRWSILGTSERLRLSLSSSEILKQELFDDFASPGGLTSGPGARRMSWRRAGTSKESSPRPSSAAMHSLAQVIFFAQHIWDKKFCNNVSQEGCWGVAIFCEYRHLRRA